ncbi:MAG: alpha/beta hydrolase [Cellulosilyticaceae bacterium]
MITTQTLLIIGVILLLIMVLCIGIIKYSFKNVFHAPRKTREEAFDLLEARGVYQREAYNHIAFEEMKIVSEDGYMLRGQYLEVDPKSKKVVILIHGYTANHLMNLQFIEMYKEMRMNMLMIDTRSHGTSGAMYPTYGIKEQHDVKRWVLALREKLGQDIKIGLHGQSMGAATALMYAGSYNDVTFVVADCAFSSAEEVLKYQFKTIGHIPPNGVYKAVRHLAEKKIGIVLDEASPKTSSMESTVPVLFIHGTADKTIPSYMSQEMYENRKNEADRLVLIEGAGHVEAHMVEPETYKKAVQEFITKH